jgi:SAM-dependent methyltransferase
MREVISTSSDCNLSAIIAKPAWIEALNQWHKKGWHAAQQFNPFGLAEASWTELKTHLVDTGWFISSGDRIAPTVEGRDFLTRVNELCRAVHREYEEDRIVIQILSELPRGPAVDIGCGPGHSVLRLARLGYSPLSAYDMSRIAIDIALAVLETEGKTAHLYVKDATNLPDIESASLALIYSRGALHYFGQGDLAETFSRTLRPGGHVVAEMVSLRYYLQAKHLRSLMTRHRWRQPVSYARTVLRTLMYEVLGVQPRLAAGASEIGYTKQSIRRFARKAGLEVLSISPAPSAVDYLVVMRKPS